MRKLLLLLSIALSLGSCKMEKHLAESPTKARYYYQHRQRQHQRERPRRLANRYQYNASW